MDKQDSAIDRFFLRISYTAKYKLVLFFSYLTYAILAFLAFLLFIHPVDDIERQRLGVSMFQEATAWTAARIGRTNTNAVVDSSMDRLFLSHQLLAAKSPQKQSDAQTLETQLARFRSLGEVEKNGVVITSQAWLEAYRALSFAINRVSGWQDNPDGSTRTIAAVVLNALPVTTPERLNEMAEEVRSIQLDNPVYAQEPLSLKTNEALGAYRHAQNDPAKALGAGFTLSQSLTAQWLLALNTQIHTLQKYSLWALLPLIIGTVISILFYLSRIMQRPVDQLVKAAEEFVQGHFDARVPMTAHDEVGAMSAAFNKMTTAFESDMHNAAQYVHSMEQYAAEIVSSGKQLDDNYQEQDKTLKDINSRARDLLQVDQEFEENVQKISDSATHTEELAAKGQASMHAMESVMQRMILDSSSIVKTLASLQDKIGTINQVIETIVKVADQSNLLSLNTAIRASQAGTQGSGFAVIANKIREMADQIAYATLDIEEIIQEVVSAVMQAVQDVGLFSQDVLKQVHETQAISEELNRLATETQRQIRHFAEIHEGIQGQTQNIEKINTSIEQLQTMSQQSAVTIGALYTQIEGLHASSQELQMGVSPPNPHQRSKPLWNPST